MTLFGYEWTLYGGLAGGILVLLFVVWIRYRNFESDYLKLKFLQLSNAFRKEVEDSLKKLNTAILNAKNDLERSKNEFKNWVEIEKGNMLRNNNYYQGFLGRTEEENKHMSLQFKNIQMAKENAIREVNSWKEDAEKEIDSVQNKVRAELEEFEQSKKKIVSILENLTGELEARICISEEKKLQEFLTDLYQEIKKLY